MTSRPNTFPQIIKEAGRAPQLFEDFNRILVQTSGNGKQFKPVPVMAFLQFLSNKWATWDAFPQFLSHKWATWDAFPQFLSHK